MARTALWITRGHDAAQASQVAFTEFFRTAVDVQSSRPATLRNVQLHDSALRLAASGSSLSDAVATGSLDHADAAVTIAAAEVTVSRCTVAHSRGDGIRIDVATGVRVNDCNLQDNGGYGLRNLSPLAVDARDNWWGDPTGPLGPSGDGVSGPVHFQPFRDSPIDHWRSSTPPVPHSRGAHSPGPTPVVPTPLVPLPWSHSRGAYSPGPTPLVPHSPTRRSIRP